MASMGVRPPMLVPMPPQASSAGASIDGSRPVSVAASTLPPTPAALMSPPIVPVRHAGCSWESVEGNVAGRMTIITLFDTMALLQLDGVNPAIPFAPVYPPMMQTSSVPLNDDMLKEYLRKQM